MSNTETPKKIMTLICAHGNHEWTRGSQRGRPPKFCPEHTAAGADNKTGARKQAQERKVESAKVDKVVERVAAGVAAHKATVVADGEDISPQELQERMAREARKAEATAKRLATLAAKAEAKAAEERERQQATIARLTAEIPNMQDRYAEAFEIARKDNTKQAWNKADAAQMRVIQSMKVIRQGVTV